VSPAPARHSREECLSTIPGSSSAQQLSNDSSRFPSEVVIPNRGQTPREWIPSPTEAQGATQRLATALGPAPPEINTAADYGAVLSGSEFSRDAYNLPASTIRYDVQRGSDPSDPINHGGVVDSIETPALKSSSLPRKAGPSNQSSLRQRSPLATINPTAHFTSVNHTFGPSLPPTQPSVPNQSYRFDMSQPQGRGPKPTSLGSITMIGDPASHGHKPSSSYQSVSSFANGYPSAPEHKIASTYLPVTAATTAKDGAGPRKRSMGPPPPRPQRAATEPRISYNSRRVITYGDWEANRAVHDNDVPDDEEAPPQNQNRPALLQPYLHLPGGVSLASELFNCPG